MKTTLFGYLYLAFLWALFVAGLTMLALTTYRIYEIWQ